MFLSKKSLRKILIITGSYFLIAAIGLAIATLLHVLGGDATFFFVFFGIIFALGFLFLRVGFYSEGTGKIITTGTKLVRNDLKPAEFIKQYEILKNSNDLVIKKPSTEILLLVMAAHNALDNDEATLATADEMIAITKGKKKSRAMLLKASILFSIDKKEEAESLFQAAQKEKLDVIGIAIADSVFKGDRARAMGDYKTVEAHTLSMLSKKFPKPDNLTKLGAHYILAETYKKTQDIEKAIFHYQYCVEFGGETAIRSKAKMAIEVLKQS